MINLFLYEYVKKCNLTIMLTKVGWNLFRSSGCNKHILVILEDYTKPIILYQCLIHLNMFTYIPF